MNMVIIALQDGRRFQEMMKALRAAGAQSATILDAPGVDVLFLRGIRASLNDMGCHETQDGKTIMTMVPEALTQDVIEAAERVLVGFSGMVCSWPVGHFACFQGEARAGELMGRVA